VSATSSTMSTGFGDINAMASLLGGGAYDPDDVEDDGTSYGRRAGVGMTPATLGSMKDDGVAIPAAKSAKERGDPKAIWYAHALVILP
jgi:hypothetical protein